MRRCCLQRIRNCRTAAPPYGSFFISVLLCPSPFCRGRWGSGWRNSDHQSRLWREGSWFSNHLPACPPQREACEEIAPEARPGENISPCESPRDRPDPMKELPPQDDDPNSSSLNPMGDPLSLPGFSRAGFFLQELGVGKSRIHIDKIKTLSYR